MASYEQDKMEEAEYGHRQRPAARRITEVASNGAIRGTVGEPIFLMQIAAMQEVTQRLYGMTHKLRGAADLIKGEMPPEKGSDQVSPNPVTVEQAWQMACEQLERLDNQVNRFYV